MNITVAEMNEILPFLRKLRSVPLGAKLFTVEKQLQLFIALEQEIITFVRSWMQERNITSNGIPDEYADEYVQMAITKTFHVDGEEPWIDNDLLIKGEASINVKNILQKLGVLF